MKQIRRRVTVNILPEWQPMLEQLKEKQFSDSTNSEMIRYVIRCGLLSAQLQPRLESYYSMYRKSA